MRCAARASWVSGVFFLAFLCVLWIAGCGGEDGTDGDGDGDGGGDAGIHFTALNVTDAARVACGGLEIFPRLSLIFLAMAQATEPASGREAGGPRPAAVHDLGDLGLCSSGESNLSWNDADGNEALGGGDVLTLTMINCDGEVNGTVALTFQEVAYALTTAGVVLDLIIQEVVDGSPQTESLTGRFRAEVNRVPGPPETAIFRYLVEQTDGSSRIVLVHEGKTAYSMGCFNLYFVFNLESDAFTLSEPLAVFRIPGMGVMSMQSFGLPPLVFADGEAPESGQAGFYAYSTATPCAGLDIGGGGVDSNNSGFLITATGSGGIVLGGITDSGTTFSVHTTWSDLVD
jgi:hypothetical protein